MPPELITVFRVFASGEPETFDDISNAVTYFNAQAFHSEALKHSPLSIELAQVTIEQYRHEVEKQDGWMARMGGWPEWEV
jgi:pterin-4a-carbinolamine dehydratase